MSRVMDAYYSSEATLKVGHALYRSQLDDRIVAVTEVIREGREPLSVWPDLVFVGKVTKFVDAQWKPALRGVEGAT